MELKRLLPKKLIHTQNRGLILSRKHRFTELRFQIYSTMKRNEDTLNMTRTDNLCMSAILMCLTSELHFSQSRISTHNYNIKWLHEILLWYVT